LSACGGSNNDNDNQINALERRVDRIESQLGTLSGSSSATMATLEEIESRLAAIDAQLTAIESSNTATSSQLAEITASLDAIEMRLASLESSTQVSYQLTLTNVTENQPLAPFAAILHGDDYVAWHLGQPASSGLEKLAESGSPAELIAEAATAFTSAMGDGILAPGETIQVELTATISAETFARHNLALTLASMPVNTNDGFSGITGWNIAELQVGESQKMLLPIYDAGTEANSEMSSTIPGPAGGGEGFNAVRDDIANQVTYHPGVVTDANDYDSSTLDASHLFDQGAIMMEITRL